MKKIFEDEIGAALEKEYFQLFGKYPTWYWQQETVKHCYERIRKEIEEKKKENNTQKK